MTKEKSKAKKDIPAKATTKTKNEIDSIFAVAKKRKQEDEITSKTKKMHPSNKKLKKTESSLSSSSNKRSGGTQGNLSVLEREFGPSPAGSGFKRWKDDGLGGKFNAEGYTGRVEDGVKVFKAHVLNKPDFGNTKDCPFDCQCCFI